MKNIQLPKIILAGILSGSLLSEAHAEYLQGQCVSGEGYFDVKFAVKPGPDSPYPVHHEGISIQKPALAMRYPPTYYAVLWKDIVSISFVGLKNDSNKGILTINFKGLLWGINADELGLIDRSCWNDLSKFIQSNGIEVTVKSDK